MLTIVGGNLRRNLLKSIPSSEKFFKKVKMSKPFQLFELKNVLGSCSSSHKIDYTYTMPHKQSLRRRENLRGFCTFFKEISSKSLVIKKSEKKLQQQFWAENLQKHWRDAFLSILELVQCSKEAFCLLHYKKKRVFLQFDIKFEGFGHLDHLQKNFSELRMIFNKFLLGLPPIKVNIDSELFSLGLTQEMSKFCIH